MVRSLLRSLVLVSIACLLQVSCETTKLTINDSSRQISTTPARVMSVVEAPIVTVKVYIAPGFSEREHVNIINGIVLWERATEGQVTWTLESSEPNNYSPLFINGIRTLYVVYKRITPDDAHVKKWDKEHSTADNETIMLGQLSVGYADDGVPAVPMEVILVEGRLTTPRDEILIPAHEFGHVLGLGHVTQHESLLSERYGSTVQGITTEDLELFCRRYPCHTKNDSLEALQGRGKR